MTSSRPYLLRALYDWIVDNQLTPHIMVNALAEGVSVPQEYVKDGQIVLNVAPSAVRGLSLANDWVAFSARFRGIPTDLQIPTSAVIGIYARENGQGMMFDEDGAGDEPPPPPPEPTPSDKTPKGSHLRVVK